MQTKLHAAMICAVVLLGIGFSTQASADNLTQAVQKDLVILGYDPGNIDGEPSTATTIAIAKFETDHDMEMTGEVTPQLAGKLSAMVAERNGVAVAGTAESTPAPNPAALEAAKQACLEEKIAEARKKEKKSRGFSRLLSAVGRTAGQLGNESIAQTADGAVAANQTAADLSSAARDLGITDDEIAACENPM